MCRRSYTGLVDHPKFVRLNPEQRSALIMMWCVVAENGGKLPPIGDIAIKWRMPEAKVERLLDDLRRAGFLDGDEAHNWNTIQV